MYTTRTLAVVAAAVTAAILPAMPASADPPDSDQNVTTFHGTWVGGTAGSHARPGQSSCDVLGPGEVTGGWNVTLKKDGTASISIRLFVNDAFYIAWGGNFWSERFTWTTTQDGVVATLDDGYAPVPMTMELPSDPSDGLVTFTFAGLHSCGDGFLLGSMK